MLVSAAWIGPSVLAAINQLAQARIYGAPRPGLAELLFDSGDWLLYAFLTPAVFAIARRWPLSRPHLGRRAVLHLAMSLLFCAAWAGAGTVLRAVLMPKALEGRPGMHFVSWLFITLPFGVAVYLAVVGIEHAIRYFVEARDREIQMARLSEQLTGARFAALQAQLNPHFLFNTLNTITVLVRDGDRTGATRMVEQLSDILRRTLSPHRTNEVTLDEELELVRQYLAIEQARFSDRLRPEFEIDAAVRSAAVPGFTLQHLVENAMRHGIAKRSDAGLVRVVARRLPRVESRGLPRAESREDRDTLEISVIDDGVGITAEAANLKSHGLENTRERLRALYGEEASLVVARRETGGTIATMRLPYREMVVESDGAS